MEEKEGTYLTREQRRPYLERAISDYVIQGYDVVDQTDVSAEMYRPHRFDLGGCLLGFGIFYLYRYLTRPESAIRIEVDNQGNIKTRPIPIKPEYRSRG